MKARSLTQSMSDLHTWSGLFIGWALFAIFLTGTLAVFEREITWWMQPEIKAVAVDQAQAADVAQRYLKTHHADAPSWNITLPIERTPLLAVSAGEQRRGVRTVLDVDTGQVVEPRATAGGNFFFRFHYTLNFPRNIGIWLVGFAAMAMLVAIVSGVITHKKIFKDFFTFRPAKGQRSWLDGHNASAVLLLPFHVMITYTGLVIFFLIYMPAALETLYDGDRKALQNDARVSQHAALTSDKNSDASGQREARRDGGGRRGEHSDKSVPEAVAMLPLGHFIAQGEAHYGKGNVASLVITKPNTASATVAVRPLLGNRIELTKGESMEFNAINGTITKPPAEIKTSQLVQRVMAGLHFAQFGGYPMRWLYFVCGLISTTMIGSGLVLYTVKQRRQAKGGARKVLDAVEILNIATIAGLSLACVALLWANRVLPVGLEERSAIEVRVFFYVWLLSLGYAAWRPVFKAWRELLGLAALLCMSVPVLGLIDGYATDTIRLGVELTSCALGLLLAWMAWQIPVRAESKAMAEQAHTEQLAGAKS